MSQLVKCPCCETELPTGHKARLGILINDLASAGAEVVEATKRLSGFTSKNHPKYDAAARALQLAKTWRDYVEEVLREEME